VARWRTIYIPSYQGFVPILEDAIADVTAANPDVV
jgi:hypothetical protein